MDFPTLSRITAVRSTEAATEIDVEGFDQPLLFDAVYANFVEPGHCLVSCPEYQGETFGHPFFVVLSTPEEFRAKLEAIRRDAH